MGKRWASVYSEDSSSSDTPYSELTSQRQPVEEAHFIKDVQVNKETRIRGNGLAEGSVYLDTQFIKFIPSPSLVKWPSQRWLLARTLLVGCRLSL